MEAPACARVDAVFSRLSSSRGALGPLAAFAGGTLPSTLLSACAGALLPLLSSRAALPLRAACREAAAAVASHPWEDCETLIRGSVGAWRACFPRARAANVAQSFEGDEWRLTPVADADFVHLEGLWELNMSGCTDVTDAAFARLAGIRTLNMSHCTQEGITDAAFAHLRGIHTLNMGSCYQQGISDAAFAHLAGIHTLVMSLCSQDGITDAAFEHLRGIAILDVSGCSTRVTGRTFGCLGGRAYLVVSEDRTDLASAAIALGLSVISF